MTLVKATMTQRTILLVDDDKQFRDTLKERLELRGFVVVTASGGHEALAQIRQHQVDLAVVDMQMPDMDGLVTIAKLKEQKPELRTVLLTGHGTEKLLQATDGVNTSYFEKKDMGSFWDSLSNIKGDPRFIIVAPGGQENDAWPGASDAGHRAQDSDRQEAQLIGNTEVMQALKRDISRVASMDCPVLVLGEQGTGRKLMGRIIHDKSLRRGHRFLAINCGAFSEEYLLGELFGHTAAEGSHSSLGKTGLIDSVRGGTLFLEEIAGVPLSIQEKFSEIIGTRSLQGPGGAYPYDMRLIASSCAEPDDLVEKGRLLRKFHGDLNVFTLRVPPLRERKDDILPLCGYFLKQYNRLFNKNVLRFGQDFLDALLAHDFPGNVHELDNIVERAVISCLEDTITRQHLPAHFKIERRVPRPAPGKIMTLAEMEEQYIVRVLDLLGGNKNEAARALGISRASLWRKLKKIGEDAASVAAKGQ